MCTCRRVWLTERRHVEHLFSTDVVLMLCSAALAEWLPLKPWRVEMCGMLPVMHGSSVFSSVLAITERSEMGLHDLPMFMSPFGLGIGMMSASLHA